MRHWKRYHNMITIAIAYKTLNSFSNENAIVKFVLCEFIEDKSSHLWSISNSKMVRSFEKTLRQLQYNSMGYLLTPSHLSVIFCICLVDAHSNLPKFHCNQTKHFCSMSAEPSVRFFFGKFLFAFTLYFWLSNRKTTIIPFW